MERGAWWATDQGVTELNPTGGLTLLAMRPSNNVLYAEGFGPPDNSFSLQKSWRLKALA